MNYFELYNIPQSFHPDAAEVKKKYYELSRRYHPDRFTMADEASQTEALRISAMNNEAYKVLNNADATMAYILKLHGMLEEEEKYDLPPAFLMEMMELNETVSEYEENADNEEMKIQALNALDEQMNEWESMVAPLVAKYNAGSADAGLLAQLKDSYFRKKYLLRIKERMHRFAAR